MRIEKYFRWTKEAVALPYQKERRLFLWGIEFMVLNKTDVVPLHLADIPLIFVEKITVPLFGWSNEPRDS